MLTKNVETFIGCDCEYEEAEIVLFGAPFDSTTSYRPGARFGSSAIRTVALGRDRDRSALLGNAQAGHDGGEIRRFFS